MPVYNDGSLLEKSVNSVVQQTLDNVELICVNDGSTDNSLDVLNELAKKHDFIKVLSQENQGSGKARNKGIDEAEGEYIGFLDADDFLMDNDALERVYEIAKSNDADMVSGNMKVVDVDNNFSPHKDLDYYTEDSVILPEEYGIPWGFYKIIYKKDFLMKNKIYFPDLLRGQDPVFLAEALSKVDKVYTVATDFYAYFYINGANQCNTYRKRLDHIKQFKYIFKYFEDSKFEKPKAEFKKKLFVFIDMMGTEGAEDTLSSIREVFSDNQNLVKECEEYYASKYSGNIEMLNKLDLLKNPKISVVVPVYNAEPFLKEAMESVLNQTFANFEMVCVNDGSTDNSLEMLNVFASNDERVKVISKPNGGCGSARNMALDNAKGDYIYFFDPDDYILPNAFEKLYKNAVNNDSDLVIFKIARFRDGEPVDYSNPGFDFDKVFKGADFDNFTFDYHDVKHYVLNASFAPWSKLYKKEFLDRYDNFRFDLDVAFDDTPFHVKSMIRAKKISFVPEYFYHYRLSNPNSVNNTKSNQIDIFRICDLIEEFLKDEGYFEEFINEFYNFKITQITNYIISCNFEEYYELAKDEFSKMDLNSIEIKPNTLKKYNSVLESTSYNYYRLTQGAEPIPEKEKDSKLKISVILPVYNTEKYLPQCLDSVLNQTLKEIELICIDDGSTDNSLNILESYAEKDNRIQVLTQSNKGQGAARNRAIELARGEYVYFMDSDDFLDLNTLEETYNCCEEKYLDFVMFQLINYDDVTKVYSEIDYYNMDFITEMVGDKVFNYNDLSSKTISVAVSPCNKLFNRKFLSRIDARFPEGLKFEDNVFFFKVFLAAKRVYFIRKHYYKRRRREGSTTASHYEKYSDTIQVADKVIDVFKSYDLFDIFEERLYNFKIHSIFHWFEKVEDEYREDFFYKIKENFKLIEDDEKLLNRYMDMLWFKNKHLLINVLKSDNLKEFDLSMDLFELNKKNKSLKKDKKRLKKKIKKLEKENNAMKNSKSWKITKPLRMTKGAGRMSLKERLLNKSGSYTFYKKEHNKLTKELKKSTKREKKLNKELKDSKKELEEVKNELSFKSEELKESHKKYESKINDLLISADLIKKGVVKNDVNHNEELKRIKEITYRVKEINYAQIFNDTVKESVWLSKKNFSLNNSASNYSFMYILYRILDEVQPKNILELGLGQTSKMTTQYAKYYNDSHLLIIEGDQLWIDNFSNKLNIESNVDIVQRDVETFTYNDTENLRFKDFDEATGDNKFDLIIIDGPQGFISEPEFHELEYSRSNVWSLIDNNLADEFVIIIDDYDRQGEKNTMARVEELLREKKIEFYNFKSTGLKEQYVICSSGYRFVSWF